MINFGKIELTSFKNSEIAELNSKRGVFIPIEDNFLFETRNKKIFIDILTVESKKIHPFTHNILRSVPEKFRESLKFKTKIGGIKL